MTRLTAAAAYKKLLRNSFNAYRRDHFAGQDHLFELRPDGGPVVFQNEHATNNILLPPQATGLEQQQIVAMVTKGQRHRYFGSMQSSQALAQSVFGTIEMLHRLPLLSSVMSDDGRSAFGLTLKNSTVVLEKSVDTLGEPRSTSVDVWISGLYCVAVECKLAETEFGQCSRPRLTAEDASFSTDYCDGSYTQQLERTERCALTQIDVRYWRYVDQCPSSEILRQEAS
jgi:hypothetical protein